MSGFVLFATPWWVNLLILIPIVPYLLSTADKIRIGRNRLLIAAAFGIAFGFVEAAVVVYLRAAIGLLPGQPLKSLAVFPENLLRIECFREAATMIMLGAIAALAGRSAREKVVAFLWTFAFWDIFYYVWLRLTILWPVTFLDTDLLFLIPVPWVAQVWFPILVSCVTALVIWLRSSKAS
jgi:hypothetical protein